MEEHRLQLKLSGRARGVLVRPGLFSQPLHAGVVFAAGMDAIMGAVEEGAILAEAVNNAMLDSASARSQARYPSKTGGQRSGYIRTNIPVETSLFDATLHRMSSTIPAVRVVVRTRSSVFGDAERLAADHRAVKLHHVRTCAIELGVARVIEAIDSGVRLSLDALADHLGVSR